MATVQGKSSTDGSLAWNSADRPCNATRLAAAWAPAALHSRPAVVLRSCTACMTPAVMPCGTICSGSQRSMGTLVVLHM